MTVGADVVTELLIVMVVPATSEPDCTFVPEYEPILAVTEYGPPVTVAFGVILIL